MNLSPLPIQKFFDNNGDPLVGGLLFTYIAGTTTKLATYTDSTGGATNTNPVVLNYRGEANVWLDPTLTYKFVLSPPGDTDPPTRAIWTVDNVSSLGGITRQIIGQLIFPRTAMEIAAAVTPVDYGYPEGDVRRYGALMNGIADDTGPFQTAGIASLNPYAPPLPTIITGSIPILSNQQWSVDGCRPAITGTTVKVFTATSVNDWSILGRFKITGDNDAAGSLSGSAAGIEIVDCQRYYIEDFEAIQIRGWGVRVRPGASASNRGEKGVIKMLAAACYVGFETEAGTGSEYLEFANPIIVRCATGAKVAAGNTEVTGGKIVDNTLGVWLLGGTNQLHCVFNGTLINHNTTQIYADGVTAGTITNGHWFRSCAIYQGIIHLNHCFGITFDSCTVDVDTYRFEETDGCGFRACTMPGTYPNTIVNDYNGTHSYCFWEGCRTLKGEPWNGGLGNIEGIRVTNALAANQVFSAANVNASAVIKLDDSANASANNATQTVVAYDAYSAATGIFTCVKGGRGKVRVTAQLVITNNAADADKFQCYCSHSTLGDYYFSMLPMGAAPATTYVARLDLLLPIDLTQTLTFKIGSFAGGVANNVTVTNSGGTKAQVEGL